MIFNSQLATILMFSLAVFHATSQDELEGVFDDPVKDFSLGIGTDFVRTLYGTPNLAMDVLMKDKFLFDVEIGSPLFGYKDDLFGFERNVHGGIEFNLGTGMYVSKVNFYGDVGFYIGLEYERWNYNSSNLSVADDHRVSNATGTFAWAADYSYELDPDSEFRFKRKLNRFGVDFGAHYELSNRFSLLLDFHIWYAQQRFKFDEPNSKGVTWVTEAPTDWIGGFSARNVMGARFSITLKYRLI